MTHNLAQGVDSVQSHPQRADGLLSLDFTIDGTRLDEIDVFAFSDGARLDEVFAFSDWRPLDELVEEDVGVAEQH